MRVRAKVKLPRVGPGRSLGIQLGDVTRSGFQANVIGIQSEAVGVYDLCCVRAATIPKTTATER